MYNGILSAEAVVLCSTMRLKFASTTKNTSSTPKYKALAEDFSASPQPLSEEKINAIVNFLSEDLLRSEFRRLWLGTQIAFCKTYPIAMSTFNGWLNERKNCPLSVETVRDYLYFVYKQKQNEIPITHFDDNVVTLRRAEYDRLVFNKDKSI